MQCGLLPCEENLGARFLTVRAEDLEFSSVYVPCKKHPKMAWLQQLREHIERCDSGSRRSVLAGEFNVVLDSPHYTKAEKKALNRLLNLGFSDLYDRYRCCHKETGPGYNFGPSSKKPLTSKLQLILGTKAIVKQLCNVKVDKEYRRQVPGLDNPKWPLSAPVVVDLAQ
ncbi:MAG: hypothetical protein OXN89_23075 [Bryobacterales bacterium]|nr:hypothetical protein [Bryobacterales bacterium]